MSWLGTQLGNVALSAGMYGAFGALTYDSDRTDPWNQTVKTSLMLGTDLAIDTAILTGGAAMSSAYKGVTGAAGRRFGTPTGATVTKFGGAIPDKIEYTGKKFKPKSLTGKAGNHVMRHLGGYGLMAHMALGFMGADPATLVMNAYESGENTYRQGMAGQRSAMTESSSRYLQDQLYSMKNAGNHAEFMHN